MRVMLALVALTVSTGTLKADEDHSMWWYAKAKVACLSDVVHLCRSAMPDTDKVRDCMKDKKALVSASCAEFYPGGANAE